MKQSNSNKFNQINLKGGRVGRSTPKLPPVKILFNRKWVEMTVSWFLSKQIVTRSHNPYTKGQGLGEDIGWILSDLTHISDPIIMREKLKKYKTSRALFFKILGQDKGDRKVSLQNLPKGTPLWVPQLVKIFDRGTTPEHRYWTTILYSTRIITLPADPDYSTITDGWSGDGSKGAAKAVSQSVGKFWNKCGIQRVTHVPKTLLVRKWHYSTQMGPNGWVLGSLVWDAKSLTEETITHLGTLGGEKVTNSIHFIRHQSDELCEELHPLKPGRDKISRKIAVFPDMEGKTRIIAELDYFSQASLKPLHHLLFRILKSIRQDFTFDQDGAKTHMSQWEEIFSADLTAATDRFPIELISRVLSFLPQSYTKAWEAVMVDLPFRCPDGIWRKYQKGNPMGAYSSWASFALAHHYIVMRACEVLGLDWYTAPYVLLGDDIAFGHKELYREYRAILRTLEVEVSDAKTHESKTLGEFAKRLYFKGQEITPFPLRGLKACKTDIVHLTNFFFQEERRGYTLGGTAPFRAQSYQQWVVLKTMKDPRKKLSQFKNSLLLGASSLVAFKYQKKVGFDIKESFRELLGIMKVDPQKTLHPFTLHRLLLYCYLELLNKSASQREDMNDEPVENSIWRTMYELPWEPSEEGSGDPEQEFPLMELSRALEREIEAIGGLVSSLHHNISNLYLGSPIPRMVVKHLGIPSLERAFSVSESRNQVVASGKIGRLLCKVLKEVLSGERTHLWDEGEDHLDTNLYDLDQDLPSGEDYLYTKEHAMIVLRGTDDDGYFVIG